MVLVWFGLVWFGLVKINSFVQFSVYIRLALSEQTNPATGLYFLYDLSLDFELDGQMIQRAFRCHSLPAANTACAVAGPSQQSRFCLVLYGGVMND